MKKVVYLAGKITGDPNWIKKLKAAEEKLRAAGYIVLSPTVHPAGLPYQSYIIMDRAMLDVSDIVCFMADWVDSNGAHGEYGRAVAKGKQIMYYEDMAEA